MTILVDADSCPIRIREIICKASRRLTIPTLFVANTEIPIQKSTICRSVITEKTDQAADTYIIEQVSQGDLVITRDIPLAKELVDKNIVVINDRGTTYTKENINERLSIRNFMYELQTNGFLPERTRTFGKKEIMEFANALDRELQKLINKNNK